MGSAAVQGQLWGTQAQDFAAYLEQVTLPLRAHTRSDGSIRYENIFLWVVGERP